jgi:hypothetical protein
MYSMHSGTPKVFLMSVFLTLFDKYVNSTSITYLRNQQTNTGKSRSCLRLLASGWKYNDYMDKYLLNPSEMCSLWRIKVPING